MAEVRRNDSKNLDLAVSSASEGICAEDFVRLQEDLRAARGAAVIQRVRQPSFSQRNFSSSPGITCP